MSYQYQVQTDTPDNYVNNKDPDTLVLGTTHKTARGTNLIDHCKPPYNTIYAFECIGAKINAS